MWIAFACLSALFAGATAILAKVGIRSADSDVATAVRTGVVLLFAWGMVFVAGSQGTLAAISGRSLLFLGLSGLATGASWLCYFRALQLGDINKVTPVDKSSTILSVLFAMLILGEDADLPIRLGCLALIAAGTWLMIEKRAASGRGKAGGAWLGYALASAVFAALTSVLAKVGIEGVESDLATALRTVVVLAMAWAVVFIKGKQHLVRGLRGRELLAVCLSGVATGASWLCYYRALRDGLVSVVVPIDKLSILVTVAFSWIFLKEKLSAKAAVGLALICAGTLAMALL